RPRTRTHALFRTESQSFLGARSIEKTQRLAFLGEAGIPERKLPDEGRGGYHAARRDRGARAERYETPPKTYGLALSAGLLCREPQWRSRPRPRPVRRHNFAGPSRAHASWTADGLPLTPDHQLDDLV